MPLSKLKFKILSASLKPEYPSWKPTCAKPNPILLTLTSVFPKILFSIKDPSLHINHFHKVTQHRVEAYILFLF